MNKPLVSICCLTYNHAPFVRKCLDGFLMQKTTFPIEILIHDDCSTDGTDAIIKEYAEKYPDIVKPLFETENKYSNEYRGKMDITFNYSRAQGKYIASCEGDDFWTDPLKLQKQVDFMEANPEYSVCYTRYKIYNEKSTQIFNDNADYLMLNKNENDFVEITIDKFLHKWITQNLTILFRKESLDFTLCEKYKYYRDTHEAYHLLTKGKGALLNSCTGVYYQTGQGVYTSKSEINAQIMQVEIYAELWKVNKDNRLKEEYIRNIKYLLELLKEDKLLTTYCYFMFKLFFISYNLKELLKNIYKFYK